MNDENNDMCKNFTLWVFSLLFYLTLYAQSGTYFVDKEHPAAADSNPGTEALPWLSMQHGIDMAEAGDTVWVKTGTYYEDLQLKHSGNASAAIVFAVYPGEAAIIDGSNSSDQKLIDWKGEASGGTDKNYIIFDGFEIRNGERWGFWIEGNYNIIRNCKVHNHGLNDQGAGILIRQGDYNQIIGNEVYRNGWNGIHAENSNYTIIEYNISYNNPNHFGVNIFPNTAGAQTMQTGNHVRYNILYQNMGGIYLRYQQDNEIFGNLIFDNTENGIFFHSHGNGAQIYEARSKVYNNTIVDNGFSGIYNNKATHLDIRNNIFALHTETNTYYEIFMGNGYTAGHHLDYNLYHSGASRIIYWGGEKYDFVDLRNILGQETNGLSADPKFKDLSNWNLELDNQSPAIDAGEFLQSVGIMKDLFGTDRPQGSEFDIGAYEFIFNNNAPPATPVNLRIER